MTTLEELKKVNERQNYLCNYISRLVKTLQSEDCLLNIIYTRDELSEACSELQELVKQSVELRQFLDLEDCESELSNYLDM